MADRIHIGTVTAHAPRVFPMPGSTLGAAVTVTVLPGQGQVFLDDLGMVTYEFVGMAQIDGLPVAGTGPVTVTSKTLDVSDFGELIRDELRSRLDGYRVYSFVLDGFVRVVSCHEGECDVHAEVYTPTAEQVPMFDEAWHLAREHASSAHGELRDALLKLDYGVIMRRFVSEPRAVTAYPVV